jgi:hypothetical protein
MQEANGNLLNKLETVEEESKSQLAETQQEIEYLKENIQLLANEKAMVRCCDCHFSASIVFLLGFIRRLFKSISLVLMK